MRALRNTLLVLLHCLMAVICFATHNRAGEITYVQIGPLTIRATVTTYTRTSSQAADRDSIDFQWGDGSVEVLKRDNGKGTILPNDIKVNYYSAEHTYPGRSTYTMGFFDRNRVAGILNVNYPQSVDIPFFVSTTFTLLDPQFQGSNSSAVLLQAPIDFACVGQPYVHNPNAYDADGDSLAYRLIVPFQDVGSEVPKYLFPEQILPGSSNLAFLDPVTGSYTWMSPPQQGIYNIAIEVLEYRQGQLINAMIRDMQIIVSSCNNRPPTLEVIDEICVIAGEKVIIQITGDDQDEKQKVLMTASGGPFVVPVSPAIFQKPDMYTIPKVVAKFEWQTACEHVSNQSYQVVFRVVDNYFGDTTGLAALKTLRIKVVAPGPKDLLADSDDGQNMTLTWKKTYECEVTEDNYFRGFSVWRKLVANPIIIDSCEGGLEGKGYQRLVPLTSQIQNGRYIYVDKNLERGKTYCYRVLGEFAKESSSGFLYNRVASLPSNEACAQLARDIPLLNKVSVHTTSVTNGEIDVHWIKPLKKDFDISQAPGSYKIVLSRKPVGTASYIDIKTYVLDEINLFSTQDTSFKDIGLNTEELQYEYKIQLYYENGNKPYTLSPTATSVKLSLMPSDMQVKMNWTAEVPWSNYLFEIYRKKEGNDPFEKIHSTFNTNYNDIELEDGINYCYYVVASGSYNVKSISAPLINLSQISCTKPIDNLAPCAPKLSTTNFCENSDLYEEDDLFNDLTWTDPNLSCENGFDVISSYNIYFGLTQDELSFLANVPTQPRSFRHFVADRSLAGCYYIRTVDDNGNESEISDTVCVGNCPIYELPNTFTPNGDGDNELFRPMKSLFVSNIDMKIFNEWGNLVYETTDPDINWKGESQSGKQLSAGTYYYTCLVNESLTSGSNKLLKGFIHLIR